MAYKMFLKPKHSVLVGPDIACTEQTNKITVDYDGRIPDTCRVQNINGSWKVVNKQSKLPVSGTPSGMQT